MRRVAHALGARATMAVMQREVPNGTVRMRPRRSGAWSHPVTSAALCAIAVVVAFQVLSGLMFWAQVKIDDVRYGFPRSYQTDGYVGFGESNGQPTHFVALNLHRQVVVLAVAGDDPTHVVTIKGPYLYGVRDEYTPVTLRLVDVTGDGYPDLVLGVDHQQLIYVDEPRLGTFRPLALQERAAASQALGGAP